MAEIQVEVIDAQPLQRGVAGIDDVLARQALLRRPRIVRRAEEHLARHAPAVARQPQVGEHVAHDPLGLAVGVGLGVVEEVDAVVPRRRDQFARRAAADLVAERDPGAERQRRQLQAGRSEAAVLHGGAPDGSRGECNEARRARPRLQSAPLPPPGSSPPAVHARGTRVNTLGRQAMAREAAVAPTAQGKTEGRRCAPGRAAWRLLSRPPIRPAPELRDGCVPVPPCRC